jgi:putative endonuclease
MYFVYLLECKDGSIYTGITTDVERRISRHRAGRGARYTRIKGVKKLLYSEPHPSHGSALRREAEIKRWPRKKKLALIA